MPNFQFGTTGYENWGEIGQSRRVAKRTEAGIQLVRSSPFGNLVRDAVWNNELEPLPEGEEPERDNQSYFRVPRRAARRPHESIVLPLLRLRCS